MASGRLKGWIEGGGKRKGEKEVDDNDKGK